MTKIILLLLASAPLLWAQPTSQQLTNAAQFQRFSDRQKQLAQVALLAQVAQSLGLRPTAATAAAWSGVPDNFLELGQLSLLNQLVPALTIGSNQTPAQVSTAAAAWSGVSDTLNQQLQVGLLNQFAGQQQSYATGWPAAQVGVLSSVWGGLSDEALQRMQVGLLNLIQGQLSLSATGTVAQVVSRAAAYARLSDAATFRGQSEMLAQIGGVGFGGSQTVTPVPSAQTGYPVVIASAHGAFLDSNINTGGGHDDTAALQALIDGALISPVEVYVDGVALLQTSLIARSNCKLHIAPKGGLFLASGANCMMIRNLWLTNAPASLVNFTMEGGTWNGNGSNQTDFIGNGTTADSLFCGIFGFIGFTDVTVQNCTLRNSRQWTGVIHQGTNFTLGGATATWDRQQGYGSNLKSWGLHMWGNLSGITISNVLFNGNSDDALAFNTDEGSVWLASLPATGQSTGFKNPYINPYAGQISNVSVFNVTITNALNSLRIVSYGSTNQILNAFSVSNLVVSTIGPGMDGNQSFWKGVQSDSVVFSNCRFIYAPPWGAPGQADLGYALGFVQDRINNLVLTNISFYDYAGEYGFTPPISIGNGVTNALLGNITYYSPLNGASTLVKINGQYTPHGQPVITASNILAANVGALFDTTSTGVLPVGALTLTTSKAIGNGFSGLVNPSSRFNSVVTNTFAAAYGAYSSNSIVFDGADDPKVNAVWYKPRPALAWYTNGPNYGAYNDAANGWIVTNLTHNASNWLYDNGGVPGVGINLDPGSYWEDVFGLQISGMVNYYALP